MITSCRGPRSRRIRLVIPADEQRISHDLVPVLLVRRSSLSAALDRRCGALAST
jgi:hypothetical protein